MRNKRGSILVVTLGFVLVFILLGFGSIQLSGMQNKAAINQKYSTKAFWLADGAVERARSKLPGTLLVEGVATDPTYVKTALVPGFTNRWQVDSKRTLTNSQARKLKVIISNIGFDVANALTANGTATYRASNVDGTVVANAGITFESIFGITKPDVKNLAIAAGHSYTNANVPPGGYSGVSYITAPTGVSYSGGPNSIQGSGLLIIDCGNYTGTCFGSSGNGGFSGIIWVVGKLGFTGTPDLEGALFVEGNASDSGNAHIDYDEQAVYDAVGFLPGGHPTKPTIVLWSEVGA